VLLDELAVPVVLAPLGGGPSTPQLTAAVSNAGGLGILAWAYLDPEQAREALAATRAATGAPIGVNVFAPVAGPAAEHTYAAYLSELRDWAAARGEQLGEPRHGDDDWGAKLDLLAADPVPVVSFAFGCPDEETIARLHTAGSEVWITVTTPQEAGEAAAAGADALVVQGVEAGGHRGSFVDVDGAAQYGLLALLQLVRAEVGTPLVASGGIATGAGIAAVLAAGASAAQLGSAFMLAPEAGTADVHREALRSREPTALTRAFSGRLARGVRNEFMASHAGAPPAYPELHYVTAPLRRRARERGDRERVNLWAGETHALARELPAAEIVARLAGELRAAAADLQARVDTAG
jgi:nitronate monooxygenase